MARLLSEWLFEDPSLPYLYRAFESAYPQRARQLRFDRAASKIAAISFFAALFCSLVFTLLSLLSLLPARFPIAWLLLAGGAIGGLATFFCATLASVIANQRRASSPYIARLMETGGPSGFNNFNGPSDKVMDQLDAIRNRELAERCQNEARALDKATRKLASRASSSRRSAL